jgi:DNA invertase Pin-like site-specific DNA recombinase
MLKHLFDPNKPLRYVRYGRMSSDRQNPRSPDQQFDTIEATKRRCGYPWQFVADYRDDAKKGLFVRKRPALQKMLKDIENDRITIDMILVDTFERFGRAEEMSEIRRDLFVSHGVLVLTADSNFADPNSVSGQALTAVESIRAKEDTRVKAHNVLRGKRDTAREGHWPGGSAPFGYRLETVLKEVKGRQEVDYSRLVPDAETAWIVQLLFGQAKESGWGRSRLTKWINAQPQIPDQFKPFKESAVGYWLESEIYFGTLVWERVNTGIVNDTRVYQLNAEEEWTVIPEFCEPLVSRDDWDIVQQLRRARAARLNLHRPKESDKFIRPLAPGLTLKYVLSGLVRCECGRAMTPSASSPYQTVSGEVRRYVAYACPAAASGVCTNKVRIPEEWLRQTVLRTLMSHLLFPNNVTSLGAEPTPAA